MSLPDYLKDVQRVPDYLTWYAEQRDYACAVDLYLVHRPPEVGRVTHVARPVLLEMVAFDDRLATQRDGATVSLSLLAAKSLMTELWRIGVRPHGISSELSRPEIDAMNAHLQDMRRLLFNTPLIFNPPSKEGAK